MMSLRVIYRKGKLGFVDTGRYNERNVANSSAPPSLINFVVSLQSQLVARFKFNTVSSLILSTP